VPQANARELMAPTSRAAPHALLAQQFRRQHGHDQSKYQGRKKERCTMVCPIISNTCIQKFDSPRLPYVQFWV
jgi:hypothetical protein